MQERRAGRRRDRFRTVWTLALVVVVVPAMSLGGVLLREWLPVWRVAMPPAISADKLAPYKHVRLDSDGRSLTIAADHPPAGLYFTYPLDSSKRYIVSATGRVLAGSPSLRLRLDGHEPQWWQAPVGERTHVVGGAESLEVLIYSDAAFGYRLDSLSVRECADCRTDDDLKAEILADRPDLEDLLRTNPVAAAQALLNWASPRIAFALTSTTDAIGDAQVADVSAADAYYRLFASHRSGVYCSGAAVFTARLFQLFGFDAATIDFGIPDNVLTHVAVVIAEPGPRGPMFYLADPTFNAMFRLSSGQFATIRDIVGARRESHFDRIEMDEAPVTSRDWICADGNALSGCRLAPRCEARIRTEPDRVVCRHPSFNFNYYTQFFRTDLDRAGLPHDASAYVELLERGVFSVGAFTQPATMRAFGDLLASLQIPNRAAAAPAPRAIASRD